MSIASLIVDGLKQSNPWPAFQQLESAVKEKLFGDVNHPDSPFKGFGEPMAVIKTILEHADPIKHVDDLLNMPSLKEFEEKLPASVRMLLKAAAPASAGSESHFSVVSDVLGALKGAEKIIGGLKVPVGKITIQAHVTTRIEVAGFPAFIIEENPSAWAASDGTHDVTAGDAHFSFDNGAVPSLAKAAGDLVKVVQQQQLDEKLARAAAVQP